jgi:peptidoglycan hydrolase FlgJ
MAAIPSTFQSNPALTADTRGLESLRGKAAADPRGAVKEAAKQFEAVFMNELMKSMRSTTLSSGMLDSKGGKLGTDLLDTQLSGQMAGRPGGLADIIAKQLERQMGLAPGPIPFTGSANNSVAPLATQPTQIPQKGALGFVQQHTEAAKQAEAATGIPAAFMISQSALETGWGRKEIRHADGSPSFNLFGIKATGNWKGPVAEITTTEFINGKATKVVAKFRAYGSYAESFADYARLMKESPRYQGMMQAVVNGASGRVATAGGTAVAFAQGLQKAGYATDPAYADKLSRVINTTLRLQRSVA